MEASFDPITRTQRLTSATGTRIAALVFLWGLLCAWCVHGFPPAVDLPAHAAQIQTLADVLRGRPAAAYYAWHVPVGYGLTTWLGVPIALVWNGATAARVLLWLALVLFPLAHAKLARALGHSGWVAILAAPMAFNVSYWFGFLPTVFAWPVVLFGWAVFVRRARTEDASLRGRIILVGVGLVILQSHLLAFAGYVVGLLALTFVTRGKRTAWDLVAAIVPAGLVSSSSLVIFATRAIHPGRHLGFSYDLVSHFRWVVWHYAAAQRVTAWLGWAVVMGFVVGALRRMKAISREAAALTCALAALYLATPMAISGAWFVHPRFPVLIAACGVLLIDFASVPRGYRIAAGAAVAVSLAAVTQFHASFRRSISGLDALVTQPTPDGLAGGLSLVGLSLPHQRLRFLEHLPQWWTATQGGIGNHFFADADHQPVQFATGVALPQLLTFDHPSELERFKSLLVFGDGPLPPELHGFRTVARAGHWRRLDRQSAIELSQPLP